MIVSRWGNSLAVRLPAKLVKQLGLEEGDNVVAEAADDGSLRLKKADKPDPWAKVRHLFGSLPADYKFDREEANER